MANAHAFSLKTLDGKTKALADYKGKVVLAVNVASKCGFTPQYQGLEALHERMKARGFAVVGFPCNQFGAQEPGSASEIQAFCSTTYGVTFDLFEKVDVKGAEATPLYQWLTKEATPPGDVKWNFEKFLIGKDGDVVARFGSRTAPDDATLVAAIEKALV